MESAEPANRLHVKIRKCADGPPRAGGTGSGCGNALGTEPRSRPASHRGRVSSAGVGIDILNRILDFQRRADSAEVARSRARGVSKSGGWNDWRPIRIMVWFSRARQKRRTGARNFARWAVKKKSVPISVRQWRIWDPPPAASRNRSSGKRGPGVKGQIPNDRLPEFATAPAAQRLPRRHRPGCKVRPCAARRMLRVTRGAAISSAR